MLSYFIRYDYVDFQLLLQYLYVFWGSNNLIWVTFFLTVQHQVRTHKCWLPEGAPLGVCVTKLMKSISQSSGRAVNHNNNNKGCSLGHKAQVAATGGQRCEAQSHSSPQLAAAYEIWEPRAEIPEPRELGTQNSELGTHTETKTKTKNGDSCQEFVCINLITGRTAEWQTTGTGTGNGNGLNPVTYQSNSSGFSPRVAFFLWLFKCFTY